MQFPRVLADFKERLILPWLKNPHFSHTVCSQQGSAYG